MVLVFLALEAVVLHAIAKNSADRYDSASALAVALGHALLAPEDVASVKPNAVLISIDGDPADGHALTIPSPIPSLTPESTSEAKRLRVRRSGFPSRSSDPLSSPATKSRGGAGATPSFLARHGWMFLWVVAAMLSVALGVYLSMRAP